MTNKFWIFTNFDMFNNLTRFTIDQRDVTTIHISDHDSLTVGSYADTPRPLTLNVNFRNRFQARQIKDCNIAFLICYVC